MSADVRRWVWDDALVLVPRAQRFLNFYLKFAEPWLRETSIMIAP